jgi:hypothetical protein
MIETFAALARAVLARPPRLGAVRLVAVDGPSGAGKTTFADRLARAVGVLTTVALVHTDAVLDGWAGPTSVWPKLRAWVLDPLASGAPGAYLEYDWWHARYGDAWHPVPVTDVLIVDGTTSASAAVRAELSMSVLVTADPRVRSERALARDGGQIAKPLRAWQAAEDTYFATERPDEHVDLVVDGAATVGHDPEREFVRLR